MLTREQSVTIAREKCIDLFGSDFVETHKEGFCSGKYFNDEEYTLEYSLMYSGYKLLQAYLRNRR